MKVSIFHEVLHYLLEPGVRKLCLFCVKVVHLILCLMPRDVYLTCYEDRVLTVGLLQQSGIKNSIQRKLWSKARKMVCFVYALGNLELGMCFKWCEKGLLVAYFGNLMCFYFVVTLFISLCVSFVIDSVVKFLWLNVLQLLMCYVVLCS